MKEKIYIKADLTTKKKIFFQYSAVLLRIHNEYEPNNKFSHALFR